MRVTGHAVFCIGTLLLVVGFVYDVTFAGIPYQDSTPAMQQRYDSHSGIAIALYAIGAVAMLSGLMIEAFRRMRGRRG